MVFSKKKLLFLCLPLIALLFLFARFTLSGSITFVNAEEKGVSSNQPEAVFPFQPIESFLNKTATYDINFLWFDAAAVATFRVEREGKGYKATLEGETKGFVGFLTSYRKHIYISHLEYLPETGRLRTSLFERYVVIGTREERSVTYLDYNTRLLSWEIISNISMKKKGCDPIPEGIVYEDVLSAFLNFRTGGYGSIQRGRKFNIFTIPSEGQSLIQVNITTPKEAQSDKELYGEGYNDKLVYIKVKVPKEIFKSATGEVSMWIDKDIIPIRGVVKDYIGFGDMTGILRGK